MKTALIAGATGLVGTELLRLLVEGAEYERVIAITRRPLAARHDKLIERTVDFDQLKQYQDAFAVDDVYCCLGTTIKKAKSKSAMYKIDVEYPLEIARLSSEQGAKQFVLVSSLGADPNAFAWYSRMKGELERKVCEIPFRTHAIVRPSLLLGDRTEYRAGERAAAWIARNAPFLFFGPLQAYRAIEAQDVALAMYRIARSERPGVGIYPSQELASIAQA